MVFEQETFSIISAYAPQVGLEEKEKMKFWEDLEGLVQGIPPQQKIVLGGDFNGHVRKEAGQYAGFHGGFSFGELNEEGKSILNFSMTYDFKIANTYFKKQEKHLITYKRGVASLQINFFLVWNTDKKIYKDCKVILGESLTNNIRFWCLIYMLKVKNNEPKQL